MFLRVALGVVFQPMADGSIFPADAVTHPAIGRPTLRSEAVIAEICELLESGLTLRQACSAKHLPNRPTVIVWMRTDDDLKSRIARARARGADAMAEDSLQIADCTDHDVLIDRDGNQRGNNAAISRAKLRIDTRMKLAAAWDPETYGDKKGDVNVTISLESLVLAAISQSAAKREPLNITPTREALAPTPWDDLV